MIQETLARATGAGAPGKLAISLISPSHTSHEKKPTYLVGLFLLRSGRPGSGSLGGYLAVFRGFHPYSSLPVVTAPFV